MYRNLDNNPSNGQVMLKLFCSQLVYMKLG